MYISVVQQMVSLAIMQSILVFGAIARYWNLRRRGMRSTASRISEVLHYSVTVVGTLQAGVSYYRLAQEKRLYETALPVEIPFMLLEKKFLLPLFIENVGYSFDIYCTRGAFVAMYYDLIPHLDKRLRYTLHAVAAIFFGFFVMTFLLTILWCHPISSNWDAGLESCSIETNLTGMNIITWPSVAADIMLLIVSTVVLKSLKLRGRDIWALGFIYIVGVIAIAAVLIRYFVVYNFIKDIVGTGPNALSLIEFWTTLEVFLGNFAFVLPTFRTVIRKIIGKFVPPETKPTKACSNSRSYGTRSGMTSYFSTNVSVMGEDDAIRLRDIENMQADPALEVGSPSAASVADGIYRRELNEAMHNAC